jgi:HSP20 family protein
MQWDQVRDLLALQDRLDKLLGGAAPGWSPPVDLYETDDRYEIAMELPGLARNDVRIEAQADRLTLGGARPASPSAPQRYHQIERGHGTFSRTFTFAHPIDVDHITAEFRLGILTVVAPKAQPRGTRRIAVR